MMFEVKYECSYHDTIDDNYISYKMSLRTTVNSENLTGLISAMTPNALHRLQCTGNYIYQIIKLLHFGSKRSFFFVYQQTIISFPCNMEIRGSYTIETEKDKKNRILLMPADTACLVRVEYEIHNIKDIGVLKLVLHSCFVRTNLVHGYFLSPISNNQKILIENCFTNQGSLDAKSRNLVKLDQVKRKLLKEYKGICQGKKAGSTTVSQEKGNLQFMPCLCGHMVVCLGQQHPPFCYLIPLLLRAHLVDISFSLQNLTA